MLTMQPIEGYQLEREGSHAVALELELDDSLRREGWAREIVHAVQNTRKAAGLAVEDRIELTLTGAPELLLAAQENQPYIAGETLALAISYADVQTSTANSAASENVIIDSHKLTIGLRRSAGDKS